MNLSDVKVGQRVVINKGILSLYSENFVGKVGTVRVITKCNISLNVGVEFDVKFDTGRGVPLHDLEGHGGMKGSDKCWWCNEGWLDLNNIAKMVIYSNGKFRFTCTLCKIDSGKEVCDHYNAEECDIVEEWRRFVDETNEGRTGTGSKGQE